LQTRPDEKLLQVILNLNQAFEFGTEMFHESIMNPLKFGIEGAVRLVEIRFTFGDKLFQKQIVMRGRNPSLIGKYTQPKNEAGRDELFRVLR